MIAPHRGAVAFGLNQHNRLQSFLGRDLPEDESPLEPSPLAQPLDRLQDVVTLERFVAFSAAQAKTSIKLAIGIGILIIFELLSVMYDSSVSGRFDVVFGVSMTSFGISLTALVMQSSADVLSFTE